jgi:hypothetical protein
VASIDIGPIIDAFLMRWKALLVDKVEGANSPSPHLLTTCKGTLLDEEYIGNEVSITALLSHFVFGTVVSSTVKILKEE